MMSIGLESSGQTGLEYRNAAESVTTCDVDERSAATRYSVTLKNMFSMLYETFARKF